MIIDCRSNTGITVNQELKEAPEFGLNVPDKGWTHGSVTSVTIYNDWLQYQKKKKTAGLQKIPELVTWVRHAA